MSTRRSRNEQQRGDDFEDLVCRFLKAVNYTQIEKHPKIGTKRADLLVTRGEDRFFVEANVEFRTMRRGRPRKATAVHVGVFRDCPIGV